MLLVHQILPIHDPLHFQFGSKAITSLLHLAYRQKAWDAPRIQATYNTLQNSSPDPCTRARLLGCGHQESRNWLSSPLISLVHGSSHGGRCHPCHSRATPWHHTHQCRHCRTVVGRPPGIIWASIRPQQPLQRHSNGDVMLNYWLLYTHVM